MKKHPVTLITFFVLLIAIMPIILFLVDKSYTELWDESTVSTAKSLDTVNNSYLENTTLKKKTSNSENKIQKNISLLEIIPKKPAYTVDGFDWSLPVNTKVETNSGLIDMYDRGIDYIRNVFMIVRWDEVNPKQGVYDFSKLENNLARVSSKKVLIRLEVNSVCEAPRWALKNLRSSDDKSLIFWDKAYVETLAPFINAFAKRYAADPRIIGVQLGIGDGEYRGNCDFVNKDGWGEFWMYPKAIAIAEKKFGFTPDLFEQQTKAIIDLYVNAFGEYKGKLAFTNIGPSFSWTDIADPYNEKFKLIADYVWKSELGNRDGEVEKWMRFVDKTYGVELITLNDGTCAMDFNEDYANVIQGRFWGTENEFYGNKDYVIDAHGPLENQPYRFLVSSLRALQMRRNYFSIAGDSMKKMKHPVYKTQDFLRYLTKTMGKQMGNTPDVFILLGERYLTKNNVSSFADEGCVKRSKNGVAIRSFGRWIKEVSQSTPAVKTFMPENEKYWGQNFYMPNGIDYEYFARKATKFEFDINDKLVKLRCKDACNTEIKITFKDTVKTDLSLWYNDDEHSESDQQTYQNYQRFLTKGDNKIKTVTFTVNSRFQNNLSDKDFMIKSMVKSKAAELSLIMIRVNFL